jgi:TolB-like protein/DNA-binding winged helix-turn-helix (wHTH) protein/Flp pilus assembly protein TadD
MTDASDPPKRFRFAVFEADLDLGELTRLGRRVPLQDQPFRVLAMLLRKPGELVTRESLRRELWPQAIVDFDHGVNKAISKIRDALGDSSENPRFVETIPGRGYRFLADVKAIDASPPLDATARAVVAIDPPAPIADTLPIPVAAPADRRRMRAIVAIGLVAIAVAIGIAVALRAPNTASTTSVASTPTSLAVLPFENLTHDPAQDYFADGMTDELITSLGQIRALHVISRTSAMSYKGAHRKLADIARELKVDTVVEGSVLRAGDRVRITAQLIRLPADEHIWAHSYEGDVGDTITLQRDVAQAIVRQVGASLTQPELRALSTAQRVEPEALEAYLKGRYFFNRRTRDGLGKAIESFERAIAIDPGYAAAYSGLADTYALAGDWEYAILAPADAFARSREAAMKALALDDTLADAYTSLALTSDLYAWDWSAAEASYRRALQLNPGYASAHQWYAWHLLLMGRTDEGLAELRTAAALDPVSPIIGADLADALCIARQPEASIRESTKALEIDPDFALGHYQLGQVYAARHEADRAIAEFRKAIELGGHSDLFDSNLAYVYAISDRRDEAKAILASLESRADRGPGADSNIALIHVGLGEPDAAMAALEKAYVARFNPSILLRPGFDALRADARFKDLWRRIGLPTQ